MIPVVVYHAGLGFPGGFVGVDVFFVISGFLITHHIVAEISEKRFSILDFYERRARRIFPALFAMVLVTTLAASFVMLPFDFRDYGKSVVAATLFAANIWFYREEGYFTEAAELEPLLHTWSLGVEEQYYIIFPLLMIMASYVVTQRGSAALVLLLGLFSFLAATATLSVSPEAAFYLPHLRAWELLSGSLLAILVRQVWWDKVALPPLVSHSVSIAGLLAILWPVFSYSAETQFPGLAAVLPCLGAALLICVGSVGRSIGTTILSMAPMVLIGKLSYSLYLWHWPVISLVYYRTGELSPPVALMCLAVSFGLAVLSWRFIERPIRDRSRVGPQVIATGSAAVMIVSISLGTIVWRLDGLPHRVDPKILVMADEQNYLHDRRDCHFVTSERGQAGDVCVRGAEGVEPTFVLVGDSHADAFSPAIFAAAADLGIAGYQYTNAGFVPLPGVWSLARANTSDVDAFISFVEERPTIRTLIVGRYWQPQMTGYTYRYQGQIWVDAEYDGSGAGYNATATRNGLERLASLFPDRQILILDDVPTGEELHIRDQLRWTRSRNFTVLGLPAHEYLAQRATYETILASIAEELPNVRYSPVYADLCNEHLCPLFDGETLLFRDGDHLTWEGALRLRHVARDLLTSISGATGN